VVDVFEDVQTCVSLADPRTRERKVRALREAMEETGLATGEIVIVDDEETIETAAGTIRVVPAWRWLLREELAR